jgi:acetylornithine deacetylase/succinyl-diaminopimelate desuccinylase-like protein
VKQDPRRDKIPGMRAFLISVLLVTVPAVATPAAPDAGEVRARVRAWREAHAGPILREFADLVALPNIASDAVAIRRNADAIVKMLERRGIAARLLEVEGSPPAVYGELLTPGARRTLMVYAHYDGQPVVPAQWATGPWTPVLRDGPLEKGGREVAFDKADGRTDGEWRLYGRSTGDDKAPIVGVLAALDALRAAGIPPSVNLKLFFEGEEEAGSPHLEAMLTAHAGRLKADVWVFCDGPVHQSRRLQLFWGVRGVMGLEMTVYGPLRSLHSGHYGNWAPNPAVTLAHLVAGLRGTDGRIHVGGLYDDVRPPSATERAAVAEVPNVDQELRAELALAETEPGRLVERILLPALNVRGLSSGQVGDKAANAIPTEATASIDFRLVPDQTPEKVRARVEAHLAREGWHVVHEAPAADVRRLHARLVRLDWEGGYPPSRTSMDLPVSRAVARVVEESVGTPVVRLPTMGGSLPMYVFEKVLGVPVIGLPIANHDNSQHAANENLRLRNLWDGIEVYAGLIARLGPALE